MDNRVKGEVARRLGPKLGEITNHLKGAIHTRGAFFIIPVGFTVKGRLVR
jgi:hypothetical protein